jgi:hypothetical protein
LDKTEYCKTALMIIARQGHEAIIDMYEPTLLYWHLSECDECSKCRDSIILEESK